MKKIDFKKFRISFSETYDKLQSSVGAFVIVCIAAFVVMMMVCFAVFYSRVKGPEQVLVPNVVGKTLEDGLLEMQVKELYPKINLRYSDLPGDEGTILDQSPEAGAIVRGYSRVSLVVSRGTVEDKVGNYVGLNYDDVKLNLQAKFAGRTPLIVLSNPEYIPNQADAGTILEQDPPEGYKISQPVTVKLIVSRGPNYENTRRPYVIGQSVNDMLQTMQRSKLVFDITGHIAAEGEKEGSVTSQQQFEDEFIPNYTRVTVEMALPAPGGDNATGIFQADVPLIPYPVPTKLEALSADGNTYTIISFNHPGGNVTIPYTVARNTTLVLTVADKVVSRQVVE